MQNTKEDILKNIGSKQPFDFHCMDSQKIQLWNNMMTEPLFLGEIWNDYTYFSTLHLMYHFCLMNDKACKIKIAAIIDHTNIPGPESAAD